MQHDDQGNEPEGREKPQPEKTEGGEAQSPQGVGGAEKRNGSSPKPRIQIKERHWEQMTALPPMPAPVCFMIFRIENTAAPLFIWKGNNGAYYSPVFNDANAAARYPETNLFRLFTGEELAAQCKAEGLA